MLCRVFVDKKSHCFKLNSGFFNALLSQDTEAINTKDTK